MVSITLSSTLLRIYQRCQYRVDCHITFMVEAKNGQFLVESKVYLMILVSTCLLNVREQKINCFINVLTLLEMQMIRLRINVLCRSTSHTNERVNVLKQLMKIFLCPTEFRL